METAGVRPKDLCHPAPEALQATVFICGCGHSGTSLLASMFAAHPAVHIPLRETEIFLLHRDRAAAMFSSLKLEALNAGKAFLVEKTPRHIRHLGLIREIVGAPRFIVPVRDGRDVAASIARRMNDQGVTPGIERWIHDNRIVAQERASADVFVYRHEDLVAEPASVLRSVCDFAGIPYDPGMLEYHRTKRVWFGVRPDLDTFSESMSHEQRRNWQINQPIFNSAGRWRAELAEADLKPLLEGEGRRLMMEFRYL